MSDTESNEFNSEKFYHNIKRQINILNEEDQWPKYKIVLTQISDLIEEFKYDLNEQMVQRILKEFGTTLLQCFSTKQERSRELSISIYEQLFGRCEDTEIFLNPILNVFQERLNCYDLEGISNLPEIMRPPPTQLPRQMIKMVEQSEEVRKQLCSFLMTVFEITPKEQIRQYLDVSVDCIRVLCMDPCSEIQIMACQTLNVFCNNYQPLLLHFSQIMARGLLLPLVNKKSKVKMAALNSLGQVLLCGVWKHNAFIMEMLIGFKDPNSVPVKAFYEYMHNVNYLAMLQSNAKDSLRELFYRQIGDWIVRLPDRYDHHPRLVPYILSGIFDKNQEIQTMCVEIIEEAGLSVYQEKEKEYREQIQYGIDADWTLNAQGISQLHYPHPFTKRPSLGARIFIRSHVRKFWKALFAELKDWKDDNKLSSSYLLWVSIIYSEDYMTQFADEFMRAVIQHCIAYKQFEKVDHYSKFVRNVCLSLEMLGRYLQFQTYFPILQPSIKKQMNLDIESIKFSSQALYCMVKGDLDVMVPQKGFQSKINIANEIFEFFGQTEILESFSNYNIEPLTNLILTVLRRLNEQATNYEIKSVFDQFFQKIVAIVSSCFFVQYFEQIFVFNRQNSSNQEEFKYILSEIEIIKEFFRFIDRADQNQQIQNYFNYILKEYDQEIEDINYMNQEYKQILFIIISSFYQQNQQTNILEQSLKVLLKQIQNSPNQDSINTNTKLVHHLIQNNLENKSLLLEIQLTDLNFFIQQNEFTKPKEQQINMILVNQYLKLVIQNISDESLDISEQFVKQYCGLLIEIVELQKTIKNDKDNKKMKEYCFEWVYLVCTNIEKIDKMYNNELDQHLVYEKQDKKYFGINTVINYGLSMYSTLDQSNIVFLLKVMVDRIFEIFGRVLQLIRVESLLDDQFDIVEFVQQMIQNYLDEQNQYIKDKIYGALKLAINKQKKVFQEELNKAQRNGQFGRIGLIKQLFSEK